MYLRKLYILAFLAVTSLQAQKEYNQWYFGNCAGLNFNTVPPSAITDSKIHTVQSSSSICDSNGNLLFYTSGDTIYNRFHAYMLNFQLWPNFVNIGSAVQGSMILPVPGSKTLYYVFLGLSGESSMWPYNDSMVRYSIIDMTGDGGLGEVIVKKQPLMKGRLENFAVAMHANGSDYWVLAADGVGSINTVRTTNGQFATPATEKKVKQSWRSDMVESIKFSPDSRVFYGKLSWRMGPNGRFQQFVNLSRFDNASGQLSGSLSIKIPDINVSSVYPEFSPNSKFLYIAFASGGNKYIYQYDLSVWDSAAIAQSMQQIHVCGSCRQIRNLQLGPDGKIYAFHEGESSLSVINNPNLKGIACNFSFQNIDLKPGVNRVGGPYYPPFRLKTRKINLGKDVIVCLGDSLVLKGDTTPGATNVWSTGKTTNKIIVRQKGIYWVQVDGALNSDTIEIRIGPKFKVFIGNDTAFCGKFSHMLKASSGFAKYNWNTGETAVRITVNSKGIYSIKVLDSNACPSGDTIAVDAIAKPVIKLSYDSINCKYVFLSVDSVKGLKYLWSNGDTVKSIKVENKGWYSVMASHVFCSNHDSILVDRLPMPELYLGPDTTLCSNGIVLRTSEPGHYLWSTKATSPSIAIHEPGVYWLAVSRNNCTARDTVEIKVCEDMTYYIPDAFSPDGDAINDTFRIYGTNISYAEIEIFNRWGEKIISTQGSEPFWDGTYKNMNCQESVYFYRIKIKGKRDGNMRYLKGTVTLLR